MFFKKFVVAITAGIIFSVTLSVIDYTPLAERNENVLYYSFPGLLAMGIFYIVPFFLFLGIPISILLDNFLSKLRTNNKTRNYLLSVLFYAFGGVIVTLLLLIFIQGGRASSLSAFSEVLWSVIFASLLFLHLSILLDVMLKKLKSYLLNNRSS
ncbi:MULTISPECIES: hypothetical protein [Paenibacillus]|uniref:hypothetical protein n=1 Tax=Paenibacillus TaxID=44249 RepID=UPI00078419FD|nr:MULTISPECIES: hypothetical protein [Paenibacillus]